VLNLNRFAKLVLLSIALAGSLAAPAGAAVIYDSIGDPLFESGGELLADSGPFMGNRFVSPVDGLLTSVTLALFGGGGTDSFYTIALFPDEAGAPDFTKEVVIATGHDADLPFDPMQLTFAADQPISLTKGTAYYVGIQDSEAGSAAGLETTGDASVFLRQSVIDGASYYYAGLVFPNTLGGTFEIRINASETGVAPNAVPEPSTTALLLASLVGFALFLRRSV
jgi:hypothetical protein